eukprot:3196298-Rhodomonas_salina.1
MPAYALSCRPITSAAINLWPINLGPVASAYPMSGTALARPVVPPRCPVLPYRVAAYAIPTRCPVLTEGICLMSGTALACAYAMSGTALADVPTRSLRDVRY